MEDRLQQQGVLIVRKLHLLAVAAASVLSLSLVWAYAVAQGPTGAPPRSAAAQPTGMAAARVPSSVALVDVGYIFKKHPRFEQRMNQLKADVEQAETLIQKDRLAIRNLQVELQGYNKGSANYKGLAEEITKRNGEVMLKVQLQKDEFMQREAKIHHDVYQEILQQVDYYARTQGISMVLRFNGDPVDLTKPDSVAAFMSRPVVWYAKDRDITGWVLQALMGPQRSAAPGTNPATTQNPVRPGVSFPR